MVLATLLLNLKTVAMRMTPFVGETVSVEHHARTSILLLIFKLVSSYFRFDWSVCVRMATRGGELALHNVLRLLFCLQGYKLDGYRIRCEFAKGGRSGMAGMGGGRKSGGKSEFRVKITGLPRQTSWQVGVGGDFNVKVSALEFHLK